MSGEVAEIARYLRRLEQRIAALERLEHGSGDMDINGLVVATPVSGDSVPIYDVSASANRKATISDILALSGGMNINGLTTNDTTSVNDSVPVYSAWYSANRKTTLGTIKALATNVDINGLTAASGGPTTSDSVAIYDASAFDNRKATLADIKPLMTSVDITGLTDATPATNDTVAIYDTSASGNRKATISDILALGGGSLDFDDIDSLSPIASLALDDTLAVYDESASAAGKATVQKMWDTIPLLEEVAILPTDYLAFVPDAGSTAYKTPVTDLSSMIFNDILSNDGTGSGFDADLLDGSHASAFAAASHSHDASAITTGTIDDARIPSGIARDSEVSANYAPISHNHNASDIIAGTLDDARIPDGITRDSEVMSIVLANDGAGSGLNADLLDGLTSTQFARMSGIETTNNLGGAISIQQLPLTFFNVPANGYVTLPNEPRFLIAHRLGGSNTNNCLLHLAAGGTITSYGNVGINLTNTGTYCVYWDAGSSTYRIGNNSASALSWRVLLIQG